MEADNSVSSVYFMLAVNSHVSMKGSLSIRRFWGKGERWKQKRERAEKKSPLP